MVCLQSIYGKAVTLGSPVSPPLEFQRGMFAITACGQVASCHPGVSSVPTHGVPAWYVCNHCLWTSCKLSMWGLQCVHPWSPSVVCLQSFLVGKLSMWGLQCLRLWGFCVSIHHLWKVVTLGSPMPPPLNFQRGVFAIIACGQVVVLGSPASPPL